MISEINLPAQDFDGAQIEAELRIVAFQERKVEQAIEQRQFAFLVPLHARSGVFQMNLIKDDFAPQKRQQRDAGCNALGGDRGFGDIWLSYRDITEGNSKNPPDLLPTCMNVASCIITIMAST